MRAALEGRAEYKVLCVDDGSTDDPLLRLMAEARGLLWRNIHPEVEEMTRSETRDCPAYLRIYRSGPLQAPFRDPVASSANGRGEA